MTNKSSLKTLLKAALVLGAMLNSVSAANLDPAKRNVLIIYFDDCCYARQGAGTLSASERDPRRCGVGFRKRPQKHPCSKLTVGNQAASLRFCSHAVFRRQANRMRLANPKLTIPGNTGGFTGRKGFAIEGGVRVPSLALWPGQTTPGSIIDVPMSVLDYLPTLAGAQDIPLQKDRILDGENILPILRGEKQVHD